MSIDTRLKNDRVVIGVADTGIGMSQETREKIFIPFFSTKIERGAGLGLPICRNIIAQMGGTIEVESEEGEGTTFSILLPPTWEEPSYACKEETQIIKPAAPARIMVIDDEQSICDVIREFLQLENHAVMSYTDPGKAIDCLDREPFDLVITDLGMAPLTGWNVLSAVRENCPSTKVIFLTGWGDKIEIPGNISRGPDAILAKPIELQRLLKAINRAMT